MRRKAWVLAGAAVVVATAVVLVATSGSEGTAPAARGVVTTAEVTRGTLPSLVSANGMLTHRARPDGSPYVVVNQATGTYTELPEIGVEVRCGDELYRVDDRPVLLLCGQVPAYRDLAPGAAGEDVRQLNGNLHQLGYDVKAGVAVDPGSAAFGSETAKALAALQYERGVAVTGTLARADAAFLPGWVRIASVIGALGGPAQPGASIAHATSDVLEVQVDFGPSQQGAFEVGDPARITLPSNATVTGKVERIGGVTVPPPGPDGDAAAPTIPVHISLDDPAAARGFNEVPVRVEIATAGVDDVLSVPVLALVGRSGGGFAVEVVRADDRRELVAVEVGLFDTTGGRVEVAGELDEGDRVVVPSP